MTINEDRETNNPFVINLANSDFEDLKYSTLIPASRLIKMKGERNNIVVSISDKSPRSESEIYEVKMGNIINGTKDFSPLLNP